MVYRTFCATRDNTRYCTETANPNHENIRTRPVTMTMASVLSQSDADFSLSHCRHLEIPPAVRQVSIRAESTATAFLRHSVGMNGSQNTPAPAAHPAQAESNAASDANHRDRKTGGGMLKKLKSRRSQTEKWPAVTEDELRALGSSITPDQVLGLRAITEGEF